jgi:hypothetical protein
LSSADRSSPTAIRQRSALSSKGTINGTVGAASPTIRELEVRLSRNLFPIVFSQNSPLHME